VPGRLKREGEEDQCGTEPFAGSSNLVSGVSTTEDAGIPLIFVMMGSRAYVG